MTAVRAIVLIAAVAALAGCASWGERAEKPQDDTPGGRADRAARERADEDAKARECAVLRDADVRDARGC